MSDDIATPPDRPSAAAGPPASAGATPSAAPARRADAATATRGVARPQASTRTPEQRERRGAIVAGAIALPLVTAGLVLLAVPLAIWQLATIVRTIVVVVANAVAGSRAAGDANATLAAIDPDATSGITLALAIVGGVLVAAGIVVSVLVLRAHGVARPARVTIVAVPMGTLVAAIATATIGALGGLLFGTSDSVSRVLGNAALAIALTTIGSGIATVVTGALVWLWMRGILRAPHADGEAERRQDVAGR